MDNEIEKPPTGPFRTYISGVIQIDKKQDKIEEIVRNRIKWIFDYARNTLTVGVIIFLGKVSENSLLTSIGYTLSGVLVAYILSYLEPISFHPFHFMKKTRRSQSLDLIINLIVIIGFGLVTQFGLIAIVGQIADAYIGNAATR